MPDCSAEAADYAAAQNNTTAAQTAVANTAAAKVVADAQYTAALILLAAAQDTEALALAALTACLGRGGGGDGVAMRAAPKTEPTDRLDALEETVRRLAEAVQRLGRPDVAARVADGVEKAMADAALRAAGRQPAA